MLRIFSVFVLVVLVSSCADDGSTGSNDDRRDAETSDMASGDAGPGMDASSAADMTSDLGVSDTGVRDMATRDMSREDLGGTSMDLGSDAGAQADQAPDICDEPFMVVQNPPAAPPFSGTAFITDDLITESDPSSFVDLSYSGQGQRTMFDRRPAQFITVNAHLFDAQFGSTKMVEIQVNPEFTQNEAEVEARYYAEVIGRMPAFLFRDVETVWIHKGVQPFGGGNNNLLIHTGQGVSYAAGGELEEIFIHEAAHTSMDTYHASDTRWLEAAAADGVALSTYARDNPNREDVAESLGPYLAARFRASRVDAGTIQSIEETIPNRMQYFDCLDLSMEILR